MGLIANMNLLSIILVLVFVGVFLYVVETLIPMDARIKRVIEVLVALGVLLYLLQAIGLLGHSVRIS